MLSLYCLAGSALSVCQASGGGIQRRKTSNGLINKETEMGAN